MIEDFIKQFSFVPVARNPLAHPHQAFVVGGMGGSALAGDAAAYLLPKTNVIVHREYGFPAFAPEHALHIAVSYSGNTEETLSFANAALKAGKKLAIVSAGGRLGELAERQTLPYIEVPAGIQPRNALVYLTRGVLAHIGAERALTELEHVAPDVHRIAVDADEDAHFLLPSVPLIYTSTARAFLGRVVKGQLNETAKTPAFANVFPELNHNEMQAYDDTMPDGLAHTFRFFLIKDSEDGERINLRMDSFVSLMQERGRTLRILETSGHNRSEALAEVWLRSIVASHLLAETRGLDPDAIALVEAFKKLL